MKSLALLAGRCSFPGQICTANGTLLRLDMRGFNLQCPFPFSDLAVFTDLTTLNLGRNPNVTVRARTASCLPCPRQPVDICEGLDLHFTDPERCLVERSLLPLSCPVLQCWKMPSI